MHDYNIIGMHVYNIIGIHVYNIKANVILPVSVCGVNNLRHNWHTHIQLV